MRTKKLVSSLKFEKEEENIAEEKEVNLRNLNPKTRIFPAEFIQSFFSLNVLDKYILKMFLCRVHGSSVN